MLACGGWRTAADWTPVRGCHLFRHGVLGFAEVNNRLGLTPALLLLDPREVADPQVLHLPELEADIITALPLAHAAVGT